MTRDRYKAGRKKATSRVRSSAGKKDLVAYQIADGLCESENDAATLALGWPFVKPQEPISAAPGTLSSPAHNGIMLVVPTWLQEHRLN